MPRTGRRQEILDAAIELFSDRGYHGTSVRDIASETGMLSGSLYAHIRSKEDLLHEIVTRAAEQFLSGVEEAVAADAPPAEKLRRALRAHVRVVAGSVDEARVFLHEWRALTGERLEEVRALRARYEELWTRIVDAGVAQGAFRAADPRFARLLVLSAANWTYTWYDPEGPLGPDEVADRFADLVLDGLGAGDGRIEEAAS
ncbi:MAG TPA: TetR family transcriptional regulator [Actinomycetota bacterium]|nr:TetR family transcriptional regulator [Actinomycetota bacterium]